MIIFEVQHDNQVICRAGIANESLLTVLLAGALRDERPASFHVAGMQELADERNAHVYWVRETDLSLGDRIRIRLLDSEEPSPPIEIVATDSPEYIEEQRAFQEFEKCYMGPEPYYEIRWPQLELRLQKNSDDPICAHPQAGEEHIICSISWDKWRPQQAKVYVRSFGNMRSDVQSDPTEWLRAIMHVGDYLDVTVSKV